MTKSRISSILISILIIILISILISRILKSFLIKIELLLPFSGRRNALKIMLNETGRLVPDFFLLFKKA